MNRTVVHIVVAALAVALGLLFLFPAPIDPVSYKFPSLPTLEVGNTLYSFAMSCLFGSPILAEHLPI